ncbi:lysophospholipase [Marinobacteraceae bacterium S3BR75-40.1]
MDSLQTTTHHITAPDGHTIPLIHWQSARSDHHRGYIHICHGMAEHAGRYATLAATLCEQGWTVVAHHHRGHGQQSSDPMQGHYADKDGWSKVTGDVRLVQDFLRKRSPDSPRVILGHSMGSFIAQGYLINHPDPDLAALVLSGSNYDPRNKLRALRMVARLEAWRHGARGVSPLLHTLTFGTFAKQLNDGRTEFDWLSRDTAAVDAYIADPGCGFDCTAGLWRDLAEGLWQINQLENLAKIRSDLPILIFAGDKDPVGHFGKGPARLAEAYRKSGHSQVELQLYPGMRHESLNERHREQVFDDLSEWLDKVLPSSRMSASA